MEKTAHTMWQALMATRDHIVDQAIEAWKTGGDYEEIMDTLCKECNVEYYMVSEHFKECVRFLSLKTVTVTN